MDNVQLEHEIKQLSTSTASGERGSCSVSLLVISACIYGLQGFVANLW